MKFGAATGGLPVTAPGTGRFASGHDRGRANRAGHRDAADRKEHGERCGFEHGRDQRPSRGRG